MKERCDSGSESLRLGSFNVDLIQGFNEPGAALAQKHSFTTLAMVFVIVAEELRAC